MNNNMNLNGWTFLLLLACMLMLTLFIKVGV